MVEKGIIRKFDKLGRLVIPKEIRQRLGITEENPVEIYLHNDSILIQKYEMLEHEKILDICLNAYYKIHGGTCVICSTDKVLQYRGITVSKEFSLSKKVKAYIEKADSYLYEEKNRLQLFEMKNQNHIIDTLFPIVLNKKPIGAVILLHHRKLGAVERACANMICIILSEYPSDYFIYNE